MMVQTKTSTLEANQTHMIAQHAWKLKASMQHLMDMPRQLNALMLLHPCQLYDWNHSLSSLQLHMQSRIGITAFICCIWMC